MRTRYEQRPSGLIAPAGPPKPPPEHPVLADIRAALWALNRALSKYEHTTHGAMAGEHIEIVSDALTRCYNHPDSFTISDLSQKIERLVLPHSDFTSGGEVDRGYDGTNGDAASDAIKPPPKPPPSEDTRDF